MGQPAATLGDVAAHGGSVAVGSPTVFIGGRPAARMGDSVGCGVHGTGVIAKGSATVFINGMAAARMGDPTACMVPGLPPVVRHGSLVSDTEQSVEDFEKKGGDLTMYAEHKQTDANRDGVMDTDEYAAGFSRMKGVMSPTRVGEAEISGEIEYGIANVSAKTTPVVATSDLFSMDDSAEFSGLRGSANATVGDPGSEGRNAALKVGAVGQVAHAEAKNKIFIGSNKKQVGIMLDGGAAYEEFKGEVSQVKTTPLLPGYNIQSTEKISGSAGALGLTRGVILLWNKEENRLHVGLDIGIEIGLGLEYAFEVSVGQEYKKEVAAPGFGAAGIAGTIVTGEPRVLIG